MKSGFQNIVLLALVIGGGYYAYNHYDSLVAKYNKETTSGGASSILKTIAGKIASFNAGSFSMPSLDGSGGDTGVIPETPNADPQPITPQPTTPAPKPATTTTTPPAPTGTPVTPPQGGTLTVAGIIRETNLRRTADGKGVLTESSKLDASAKVKADDIIKRQYFAHTAPDGKTVSTLVDAQGYAYIQIGENLALGQFTSDADVVLAWMNSPEHKENMLDGRYQEMGVGVSYGLYNGRYVYAAVQHFGRPTSACPAINQTLKQQVVDGQSQLAIINTYLITLKKEIDEGTAQGKDENANIATYNSSVAKYQELYKQVEGLRTQYNAQVSAFNACINK